MTRPRLTEQSENEICPYKENAILVTSLAYIFKQAALLYRNEARLKLLAVFILYTKYIEI